jgi:NAD-dependent DNA ligase
MIEQLRNQIIEFNEAYRLGNSLISDSEYDQLLEQLALLSPNDELLTKVGIEITDETRKTKLKIEMASMNKLKSMIEISDWSRLKGISKDEIVISTPKLDGLSLAVDERDDSATSRGDGVYGQNSNEHYKLIKNHLKSKDGFDFTYGEVMMSKKTFIDKYSMDFANPRNFVGGLINSPDARPALSDCVYIRYGAVPDGDYNRYNFDTKEELLDLLNENQDVKIPYYVCKLSELTEDLLIDLFHKWGTEYEIDGIIVEINDLELQNKLGRETSSNNPVWARAFKHPSFEQRSEATILGITWNISKQGLLKPILHITPVKLDGVTVSNVTGNNARFVKDMGIGVGSKVIVKRSGMVIPIIVEVLTKVDFVMPIIDGVEIDWNENGIELITLTETDDQKLKQIISFFSILEADNVGEGVVTQLWGAGYKTLEDILNLKISDLEKIDRFGKRKASIVYTSIQKSISNVPLYKLQHATGIFSGLGSKKLILLDEFKTKPTVEQVMAIEGFAEVSAKTYVDNYDRFFDLIKTLPVTIETKVEVVKSGSDLEGMVCVFTGVRRADLEEIIESRGGKIGGSVSKNTTHLIMKVKGSGSAKETKALDLGVKILTVDELEKLLK